MLAVPGDELTRFRGAVTAPPATARTGRLILGRDLRLLLAFQEATLQFVIHHLADLCHGLLHLVEGLRLVRQALLKHFPITGEHGFNQVLAFCCGHGNPPRRGAMRLP